MFCISHASDDFKSLKEKAKNGNSLAQCKLGKLYYEGKQIAQSKEKAYKWLRVAAKNGCGEAYFLLSKMYYSGDYVEIDYMKAIRAMYIAKEKKVCNAQNAYDKLIESIKKKADGGNSLAQLAYGDYLYEKVKAHLTFSVLSNFDDIRVVSMAYMLGEVKTPLSGIISSAEHGQMLRYYEMASKSGNITAVFKAGVGYFESGNKMKAVEFLEKAALLGYSDAKAELEHISYKNFSRREQALIDKIAMHWMAVTKGNSERIKIFNAMKQHDIISAFVSDLEILE